MKFSDLLLKLVPGRIPTLTPERLRKAMRLVIGQCPVCCLNLDGHAYADLASVLTPNTSAQVEADRVVERKEWDLLMLIRQWDAEADVIAYKAVRCSRREELGILRILFTAELWAHDVVLDGQRLDIEESRLLGEVIGDR